MRRWLPSAGPADGLVLGVAEAMINAIDHATGEAFTVAVALDDTGATVVVADAGPGFDVPAEPAVPAAYATGSRGLALMHALVAEVDIAAPPAATVVRLRQAFTPARLRRPAGGAVAAA